MLKLKFIRQDTSEILIEAFFYQITFGLAGFSYVC